MQVSWIDPADVAALAESLRRPPDPKKSLASAGSDNSAGFTAQDGMQGMNDAFLGIEPEEPGFEPDHEPLCAVPHVAHAVPEAPESAAFQDVTRTPHESPIPDMEAFRDHLRAIRELAVGAGLFPAGLGSGQAPAQAPEPEAPPPVKTEARVEETECEEDLGEWTFDVPLGSIDERLDAFAAWASDRLGEGEVLVVDDHGDLLWGHHAKPELILSTLMARNAASRSNPLSACGLSGTVHHALASGNTLTVIPCSTRLGMIQIAVAAPKGLRESMADRFQQALVAAMDTQG